MRDHCEPQAETDNGTYDNLRLTRAKNGGWIIEAPDTGFTPFLDAAKLVGSYTDTIDMMIGLEDLITPDTDDDWDESEEAAELEAVLEAMAIKAMVDSAVQQAVAEALGINEPDNADVDTPADAEAGPQEG